MTTEIAFQQGRRKTPPADGNGRILFDLLHGKSGSAPPKTSALLERARRISACAENTVAALDRRMTALEDIMTVDSVTGLANRRGFVAAFRKELARCGRGLSAGGLLVFIEMDNFRLIRDDHGSMAGDSCLRLVARALEADIRGMDTAARLSEDEFVLLLPGTTKRAAAGRVQDLGWRLNNLSLAWYGAVIPVRAGLGLRAFGKDDRAENFFGADTPGQTTASKNQGDISQHT